MDNVKIGKGFAIKFYGIFAIVSLYLMQCWYASTTGKSIGETDEIIKMVIMSLIGAAVDAHLLGIFKVILSCNK